MDYKKLLNDRQYEAVSSASQYLRIVAGAGSGKTRVLTYRIAYLISELHVNPRHILAITFTNKVAAEMKERALKLVPDTVGLNISTFHSFCNRFLRQECQAIGYPTSFTIYDDEDQEKLIKSIAEDMGYKKKDEIVKIAINFICDQKCKGNYPADVVIQSYEHQLQEALKIFEEYEIRKSAMYAFDFDDLLLQTIRILEEFPDIRDRWQHRIEHILIDEFQDTNDVQYHLLRLLKRADTCIYVVGDPDQTIYTWRGANQDIILHFERDFPGTETIILDRNYRSTQKILDAANRLIKNNKERIPKNLYTENSIGNDITVFKGYTKEEEANRVISEIMRLQRINPNFSYKDVAVLYRSSYLTLPFEKELAKNQLPYRIFGGLRFYQRKEIKDVLAYIRLCFNPLDDVSFERIYNVPKRGIGDTSFDRLKAEKQAKRMSYYNYILHIEEYETELSTKVVMALSRMVSLLEKYKALFNDNLEIYSKTCEEMVTEIGYMDYLADLDDGDDRIDNVKALFTDIYDFIKKNPESTFEQYLQNVSLATAQDDMDNGDYISLMTVHTAKGLEFRYVFVIGMNGGVFPNGRASDERGHKGMEEERRLCYVAFTRAMERLYLSYNSDYSFMQGSTLSYSQFFKEAEIPLPMESSYSRFGGGNQFQSRFTPSNPFGKEEPAKPVINIKPERHDDEWNEGDIIMHKAFGEGKVTKVIDGGRCIEVLFDSCGKKTLISSHPAIKKISSVGGQA